MCYNSCMTMKLEIPNFLICDCGVGGAHDRAA